MNTFKLFIVAALSGLSVAHAQTKDSTNGIKPFQLTLITPLGTNGMASYKTVNRVSLNIFAGVAKGVEGVELGGFVNVDLDHVKGMQYAGFANVVMHGVKGAQLSGFANYAGGDLMGLQGSGFCNINLGSFKGAQLAGFCNFNRKDATGLQAAGFINVSQSHHGAQLAGFANIAKNVEGLQASGFINCAKKVKGAQLGFINVADSVDGAPIGFLNIVKQGLHQFEVSADELFYANVSIRTGTHKFYNIFTAGATPKNGNLLWSIGYGAGTSIRINDKLRSDISVTAHHVSSNLFYSATSELYRFYVGVEYKVANKFYIAGGPTFNLYWTDVLTGDYNKTYNSIAPYHLMNATNTYDFNFKSWIGGRIAIRFL